MNRHCFIWAPGQVFEHLDFTNQADTMGMNTGGSKVNGWGFEEKHYYKHALLYVPMDSSGLSSTSNQTCLPLGKEKEKFIFSNTNVDAELFTITSLTFRGYSFHLEKVPLQGQMAMSAWKAAFSSYLPKSHQQPILTRLSLRCSSKILGSRTSFPGCGAPSLRLTLHPLSVIAPLHHVVSTAEWDNTSLAPNCGFTSLSSVLQYKNAAHIYTQ